MSDIKVDITKDEKEHKPKNLIGVRHYHFALIFLTLAIFYGMRTSLSVAILPMTSTTPPDPSIPTYPDWKNTDVILSSFFWGYIVTQVVAGQLSEYFGPKWFLFGTMIIGSIFHMVVPIMAASAGSLGVIICRVISGLCQGFLYPSLHNFITHWAHVSERSRVSSFVYGGASIGIVVSMPVTGAIAGSKLGWPLVFYGFGGVGLIWAVFYGIFAENRPSNCKRMPEDEKNYIEGSVAVTHDGAKKVPTPWKSIFTSLPIWAILIAGAGECWGAFTLLTEIPTYMSNLMNFDLNSDSNLSAVPYLVQFCMALTVSPLADKLISNKILSVANTRKLFTSLCLFIPALCLIWLAFVDDSQRDLAVVLLVIAVGALSCLSSGYMINIIDLAPNHSGTIIGIVEAFNNIFSILGPLTVGFLGTNKKHPILWRKVFLLAAGLFIGGGIFYDVFASGDLQAWNDGEEDKVQKDIILKQENGET